MVRLVVSEGGEVAADLAGGAFGRGAHLHPSPRCLAGAPRGLAKSFKQSIAVAPSDLAGVIAQAAQRRTHGLLASAARAGRVVVGADLAGEAFDKGKAHLLVVARDAASAAAVGSVMHAIAKGGAVAWGTKTELGSLVKKTEVGVLGIVSQPIAAAVRSAVTIANSVTEGSGPSRAVHGGDGRKAATEDR
jgi:ribosomal protein L7Ae-like RNA K-turn-binding protein